MANGYHGDYCPDCPTRRKQADEIERLRKALTPSAETKAAYMGEFHVSLPSWDEDGNEVRRKINVPWVTIKEIMAAIRKEASVSEASNV